MTAELALTAIGETTLAQVESKTKPQVAVITGGGSGIGRAVAESLSSNGWSVVVSGRTQSSLDDTVAGLSGPALAVATDVSREAAVDDLFAATVDRFQRVDLLFNNAGIAAAAEPIDELPVDAWRDVIDVNLTGSFLCARAAFAQMRRQKPAGGRIINNGSVSANSPRPFSAPYTASKHAITGLTKSLALDGRAFGIGCGQIDIGNAATALVDQIVEGALQPNGSSMAEPTMEVSNVADTVLYMASLPPEANALFLTVMATNMPFVGRG